MRHMTKWNSFFVLDSNCQGLAVSHRKIGCGSTRKISRVEIAPMYPSLEPSLPVLVVPDMKILRTNELPNVHVCLKTRSWFENLIFWRSHYRCRNPTVPVTVSGGVVETHWLSMCWIGTVKHWCGMTLNTFFFNTFFLWVSVYARFQGALTRSKWNGA